MSSNIGEDGTRARHHKYYITDDLVTFVVEERLFRVHRYFFEWESEFFRSMFSLPSGDAVTEGKSDDKPIPLPGVTIRQFESLLDFFYFRQSIEDSSLTSADWIDLLAISSRYDFEKIRKRAIKELENAQPATDPVTKVMLALKHDIPEWLQPAYVLLCERPDPLDEAEAEKLGISTTVKVAKAREKFHASYGFGYGYGTGYPVPYVKEVFGV